MTDLCRLRVDLSGSAVVGASVMTLYSNATGSGLPAATVTWLNAIKANLPPSLTLTVPGGGDLIDEVTGALAGSWSDGGGGSVTGTGVGGFAIGVGVRIAWTTTGLVDGRRVKGSTFLVPAMSGTWDSSGRMQPASVTSFNTPTQSFLTAMAGHLTIWSRPRKADATKTPPVTARAGSHHDVTAATVITTPTTLRSRRT